MGLALSKRMVEAMGGTIGVESTLGVGSRFHFELSLVEPAAEPRVDPDFHAGFTALGQAASFRGTILYIEDNLSNIRLIEQVLARYPGVQLLEATQGGLGLDLANTHAPDWILLDLHLPDMPGEEVLRALREEQCTQRIPVTILSADATPGQVQRLKAAGAREYITKPLDVLQLIALLEGTMRREPTAAQPLAGVATEKKAEPLRWTPAAISLSRLSKDLLHQLLTAVRDGEKDRLDELIAAVANEDPPSARALQELADKYEYDTLTNVLTDASQCPESTKCPEASQ